MAPSGRCMEQHMDRHVRQERLLHTHQALIRQQLIISFDHDIYAVIIVICIGTSLGEVCEDYCISTYTGMQVVSNQLAVY